ncbi:MAG: hypothetical protein IJ776_02885 [Paludibacteraceae bacterium]|nr:hypothetical protein [Paludibacteraceae bacterium]
MRQKLLLIIICCGWLCACKVQQPTSSAQFMADVQRDMPFKVISFSPVPGHDNTWSFACDDYIELSPDYEVDTEGASMVYRTTFMSTHDTQPANVIWRNIVINRRAKRVLCIDRLVRNGRTFGYVYVLQAETARYSDSGTFHWDVSDQRLMLNVADAIEGMSELSVTQLQTMNKQR